MCCCDNPGKCACGKCKKKPAPRHYDPADLVSVAASSYNEKKGERVVPRHTAGDMNKLTGDPIHGGAANRFDGTTTASSSYVSHPPAEVLPFFDRNSPASKAAKSTKPPIKFDATSNYAGSFAPPATTAYQKASNVHRHLDASQSAFLSGRNVPFTGESNAHASYVAHKIDSRPATAGASPNKSSKPPVKFEATSEHADSYPAPAPEVIARAAADRISRSPRKSAGYVPSTEPFYGTTTQQNDFKEYELPPPPPSASKSAAPRAVVPFGNAQSVAASSYGPPPAGYHPPTPFIQSLNQHHTGVGGQSGPADPNHFLSESRREFSPKPLPKHAAGCNKCGCVCPKDAPAPLATSGGAVKSSKPASGSATPTTNSGGFKKSGGSVQATPRGGGTPAAPPPASAGEWMYDPKQ